MANNLTKDATQAALETASKLQLNLVQELTTTLRDLITQFKTTHEELQADKELIEGAIAGYEDKLSQFNIIAQTFIKLHSEMAEMLQHLKGDLE